MKVTIKTLFAITCVLIIGYCVKKHSNDVEVMAQQMKQHACERQAIRLAGAQFELLRYAIDSDYMDQYSAASTFYWIRTELNTRTRTCNE